MQPTIVSKRTLFMGVFAGLALFFSLLLYLVLTSLAQNGLVLAIERAATLTEQEKTSMPFARLAVGQIAPGLPVRLKIPKIDVDAGLEYVGLTSGGAMGVPKGPENVAWFDRGPRPGEVGSSVIAGHFGWKNGIPAVFDDLHKLKKGDKLSIEDEQGKVTTFVVRELRTYDQNDDASSVFSSSDGKAHLNLITCKGVWNKAKKSYSGRLVVFTDKEAE